MKTFEISGTSRTDLGKKSTKALRAEGKVPCVLYGGKENIHFELAENELHHLIYTPNVYMVDLTIDDKKVKAIIQDMQFHPVSDSMLHMDFLEVKEGKPIIIQIPVKLHGLAAGVKEGGKLTLRLRKLKVKALHDALPDELNIDVTHLKLGNSVKVGDLSFDGMELLNAKNAVIASVNLTRAARGLAAGEGDDEDGEEGAEGGEEGATTGEEENNE